MSHIDARVRHTIKRGVRLARVADGEPLERASGLARVRLRPRGRHGGRQGRARLIPCPEAAALGHRGGSRRGRGLALALGDAGDAPGRRDGDGLFGVRGVGRAQARGDLAERAVADERRPRRRIQEERGPHRHASSSFFAAEKTWRSSVLASSCWTNSAKAESMRSVASSRRSSKKLCRSFRCRMNSRVGTSQVTRVPPRAWDSVDSISSPMRSLSSCP
mmetsp:Transcript_5401/g.17030  ORF Transcript_5401/g.17030 Transcript_5401/m.17030 type:complete len:219 (+) Transcript_5401:435-1091(+)